MNEVHMEKIELHYWLDNNLHLMDATIQNNSEKEFLRVIKEIGFILDIEFEILTEPLQEGSILRIFRLKNKTKDKKKNSRTEISNAVIGGLILVFFGTPITATLTNVVDNIFKDSELSELEKKKLLLEIELLEDKVEEKDIRDSIQKIKNSKSNLYNSLLQEKNLNKISYSVSNYNITINKSEFKNFIVVSDEIEPIIIEETLIEIIAPVLKKGNYKWKGIFDSEVITFYLKDKEFKALVQNSKVEFKTGFMIKSNMIIKRKIDNEGEVKVKGYEVTEVYEYSVNDSPVDTRQGKTRKLKSKSFEDQIRLDYDDPNNKNEK